MARLCRQPLPWLLYRAHISLRLWPHPLSTCFHHHLVRVVLCRLRPHLRPSLYQQIHHLNYKRHLPLLLCQLDLRLHLLHQVVRLRQPSLLLLLQLRLLQLLLSDSNNKSSRIQANHHGKTTKSITKDCAARISGPLYPRKFNTLLLPWRAKPLNV